MKSLKKHITYANLMSTVAVFLAISGATAFAATQLAKNSVGSKQIKKNAVTSSEIKKNAVTNAKIKNGAVTSSKIKDGAVTGAKINLTTLGTVPSASTITGLQRKGVVKVSPTNGATSAAARAAAPEQPLVAAGPFTIYAKCYSDASTVYAYTYIKTTQDGSVVDSDSDDLYGDPFLDTTTTETNRETMTTSVGSNSSSFYGVHSSEVVAVAPDGTVLRADLSVAAKNGEIPGSQGVFGAGSSCLFTATGLQLNQ